MSAILDSIARSDCIDAGVEDLFDELIAKGNTAQFAAMVALRQAPGTKGSEQAFWDGRDDKRRSHGFGDYPKEMAEMLIAKAKRAGVQIQGKWYMGGLAAPGKGVTDPEAWVSSPEDVAAVARKRNLTVEGHFYNIKGIPQPPPPDCPLNPKIVNERVREAVAQDPGLLQRRKLDDVKQEIIEKHGAPAAFKKKRVRGPGKSFVNLDAD